MVFFQLYTSTFFRISLKFILLLTRCPRKGYLALLLSQSHSWFPCISAYIASITALVSLLSTYFACILHLSPVRFNSTLTYAGHVKIHFIDIVFGCFSFLVWLLKATHSLIYVNSASLRSSLAKRAVSSLAKRQCIFSRLPACSSSRDFFGNWELTDLQATICGRAAVQLGRNDFVTDPLVSSACVKPEKKCTDAPIVLPAVEVPRERARPLSEQRPAFLEDLVGAHLLLQSRLPLCGAMAVRKTS